jgi:hypothetical protein
MSGDEAAMGAQGNRDEVWEALVAHPVAWPEVAMGAQGNRDEAWESIPALVTCQAWHKHMRFLI